MTNTTKHCPHGTYGTGCGYCGIAPAAEERIARRNAERADLIARTKANNERARAERIADKHGVMDG